MHDFCFVILCPDCNDIGLRHTVNSIKVHHGEISHYGIAPGNSDTTRLERHTNIYKAGHTITSLIDKGLQQMKHDWAFIMISGGIIRPGVIKKYLYFAKRETDILFPVLDRKLWFDEASINGIFLHRQVIDKVGLFGNDHIDLQWAKLTWADHAIGHGFTFKAIVGAKLI